MKKRVFIALLSGLACLSAVCPQDADPSRVSPDQLSSSLLKTLEDSKSKIAGLRNSLTVSLQESNQSKIELAASKAELNRLSQTLLEQSRILTEQSVSLLNINQELTGSLRTIETYKSKLKTAVKQAVGLAAVCALFLLLKITAVILRVKFRIKLPWIIDVLV
jgi:septal ring factor EnvC (AmiA/AmiB activator)